MHLLCVSRWRLVQCWCILVDDDRQILVHVHHQEEISSGDWLRSSVHQSWHSPPPQYATVVIWSNKKCKIRSAIILWGEAISNLGGIRVVK